MTYDMTSPEGETYHGWWQVAAIEQLVSMGMEEGMALAPQIDSLLAAA